MKIKYTTFSETGVRRINQDMCRVVEMPAYDRTLFAVCDGMGGYAMGDVAADIVCNSVCKFWEDHPEYADSAEKVAAACTQAAAALCTFRAIVMGTTLVMASIEGDIATIAHCGDSRCYVLRNGEVVCQTKDHTDPYTGPDLLLKCFCSTHPEDAVPDIARIELQKGDRIFLCTDGVYKSVAPQILASRLQDDKPLEDVVDVIKFLCEKNSTDNYTGILIEII